MQPPPRPVKEKKTTLKTVALMVRATIRMKKGAEQWAKSKKIHEALLAKVEFMKRQDIEQSSKRKEAVVTKRRSRRSVTNS